jgi:hypothetical protein
MMFISQLYETGWWLSVSYMIQVGGYLSVRWGRLVVICQLHDPDWRFSVSYMRQDDGYLSFTWRMMTVICRLQETGWRLSVRYNPSSCLMYWQKTPTCLIWLTDNLQSASCNWQITVNQPHVDDVYLSVIWDRLMVICQLHDPGWRLSVS